MTKEEFLKLVNCERLANKKQWIFVNEIVEGKQVQFKSFETYLQIYKINGIDHAPSMGLNVGEWKQAIKDGLNY